MTEHEVADATMAVVETDRVSVEYHGSRGMTCPLTRAQQGVHRLLDLFHPFGAQFNLQALVPVPAAATEADVTAAARWAVERYEALRTGYPTAASLGVHQEVIQDGSFALARIELGDAEYGWGLSLPGFGSVFELNTQAPPVRCALLTRHGEARYLTFETSHFALDLRGRIVLRDALTKRLEGRFADDAQRAVYQPADLAADEALPARIEANAKAMRYFGQIFSTHRLPCFAVPPGPVAAAPRWPRTRLVSPALGAAVSAVARARRVTTSAVYLACMSALVRALSGSSTAVFSAVSSNRWLPRCLDYVGTLVQLTVIAVDFDAPDLTTLLRRVQIAGLEGYRHGSHDIADFTAVGHREGANLVDCAYNNFQPSNALVPEPAEPANLRQLRARTTVTELAPFTNTPDGLRQSVHLLVGGSAHAPSLTLSVDRAVLPDADLDKLLLAIETLVIGWAEAGPDTPATYLDGCL